jgi:hypothetical protein
MGRGGLQDSLRAAPAIPDVISADKVIGNIPYSNTATDERAGVDLQVKDA